MTKQRYPRSAEEQAARKAGEVAERDAALRRAKREAEEEAEKADEDADVGGGEVGVAFAVGADSAGADFRRQEHGDDEDVDSELDPHDGDAEDEHADRDGHGDGLILERYVDDEEEDGKENDEGGEDGRFDAALGDFAAADGLVRIVTPHG